MMFESCLNEAVSILKCFDRLLAVFRALLEYDQLNFLKLTLFQLERTLSQGIHRPPQPTLSETKGSSI